MKKRILLVVSLVCLLQLPLMSQSMERPFAPHSVYLELGGQGIFYTLNYEYRFTRAFAARVGFTHFTLNTFFLNDLTITAFPIMGIFLMGGENHFFEAGIGVLPVVSESSFRWLPGKSGVHFAGTGHVGYRYQQVDGGFLFRVSIPVFVTETGAGAWGGVSLGYTF